MLGKRPSNIKKVALSKPSEPTDISRQDMLDRLASRLKVEEYFRRSGRTLRKSRFRLWFNRRVKIPLMRLAFKAAGIYGRGVRNALSPVVRRLPMVFPNLPAAFDGYQILHLSDFHIDEIGGLAEALVPLLDDLRPDLCVLTGDYRFEIAGSCREVYPRMRKVFAHISARHGIAAILGNHDAAEIALEFEKSGVRMLINDAVEIKQANASLWLAGLDDNFDYRCADLQKAMSAVTPDSFKVLLAHDPTLYREAARYGVDLYLCGHTHAGQIRLPLLGAIKKNAPGPQEICAGPLDPCAHARLH